MQALVLLAGRSTRFWPLREKALWSVGGKTVLEHQLARLKDAGIDNITLVGGTHNLDQVRSLFPSLQLIEQENLELGMQGALLSALPKLSDKPLLVVSSNDMIESGAYKELVKTAKTHSALLAKRVTTYFPGGYLTVKDGRIVSIVEKPGAGKEPSDLVNIVAHVHTEPKKLLDALQKTAAKNDDGYEQALDALFQTSEYRAVPYEGTWLPIKYPWHLLSVLPELLPTKASISKSAKVHETAVIEGPVVIEDGVKVMAHATIMGPCFIGKNTVIANNALVRQSSIGEHSVIGFGTEVARSILGNNVWTHSSYVGDSILDDNVSLGAGTVTANLRLDEEVIESVVKEERISTHQVKFGTIIGRDSRIGVHVTLAPGIKIGEGTFIESATYVTQDITDRSFVKMKNGVLTVRENTAQAPNAAERKKPV